MSAPRRLDFIGELCIALAHQWEPERMFMVLASSFDESGTHDGSLVTVMAGIMGHAAQWKRFQGNLDQLKAKYGFRIFHAKEFKARKGEFEGWSIQKCLALANDLSELTGEGLMCGAVLSVRNAEYDAYYRNGEGPRKPRLDTKYALSFRLCLVHMVSEAIRRLAHSEEKFSRTKLNIVTESGHKHVGDAERVFNEEMTGLENAGCYLLAGITFAPKTKCDPLMVADFLAHTTYMRGEKTSLSRLGFAPAGVAATGTLHE